VTTRPKAPTVPITLELEEDVIELLAALRGPFAEDRGQLENARRALLHLVYSAADGMRRPGSWERGWLVQAFGDDFTERLERDPADTRHQRPRRSPPAGEGGGA